MNKSVLFAAAAGLALAAGGAVAAPVAGFHSNHPAHALSHHNAPKAGVLYDQSEDDSGNAIVSQNFESNYAQYDSAAADDFTVPTGATWTITEIDAIGQYFNGTGPATTEHVTIYSQKKGLPKKVVQDLPGLKGKDSSGSFAIKLKKTPIVLTAGTYELSVAADLAFAGGGGEWGWEASATAANGAPAAWENPMDGFGTGCTKWEVETTCIPSGQGPNHLFILKGTSK